MQIDWQTLRLTLELAFVVSACLLLIGLPIAYWIAFSRWRWKFLIEAVVLTAIGGLIGLAIGELFSFLTNRYSPLPAYVPPWAIVIGIGISAAVGIVFGLWPAWKAAKLDPIESLRWE